MSRRTSVRLLAVSLALGSALTSALACPRTRHHRNEITIAGNAIRCSGLPCPPDTCTQITYGCVPTLNTTVCGDGPDEQLSWCVVYSCSPEACTSAVVNPVVGPTTITLPCLGE